MIKPLLTMVALATISTAALAVPTLQVGVPDGSGGYVAYTPSLSDPTEVDTAVTSGNKIVVAGAFGTDDLQIGGPPSGTSWAAYQNPNFGSAGAVLMVTVPGNLGGGTLAIELGMVALSPIYSTAVYEMGFVMPNPPSNHAPVNETGGMDNSYLFFDVGNFSSGGSVPNFADPTDIGSGEIKELSVSVTGFDWVHFDLLALVTTQNGPSTRTSFVGNPGSHDVTWKGGGGPPTEIPEPGTLLLLGGALAALGLRRRFRN